VRGAERVSRDVMRMATRGALVGLVLSGAACASTPSDYTPQIHVVPGAAARSLWIGSKNPPEDAGATPAEEADDGSRSSEPDGRGGGIRTPDP
jgi:hypothetical protein